MTIILTDPTGITVQLATDWEGLPPGEPVVEKITGVVGGDGPDQRGDLTTRIGTGWALDPVHRDGRRISIHGWAHFRTGSRDERRYQVHTLAQKLAGMWPDTSRDGTLVVDHAGRVLTYLVQPAPGSPWPRSDTSLDYRGWLRFTLDLVSEDAYAYGQTWATPLEPYGSGIGLRFAPFESGVLDFGAAPTSTVTLANRGNAPAATVFEISGDLPSGFSVFAGDAGFARFAGAVVEGAPPVVVDLSGSVTQGGVDVSEWVTDWRWGKVPPWQSVTVEWGAPQGIGYATARVVETYI